MKSFSFFTPKGGCGKTTLTILLACYLAYYLKLKVLVLDLEAPNHKVKFFRNADLELLSSTGNPLSNYLRDKNSQEPFDIECLGKEINTYTAQDLSEIGNHVNDVVKADNYDCLLIDFPACYSRMTVLSTLVYNRLIDFVYVPTSLRCRNGWRLIILAVYSLLRIRVLSYCGIGFPPHLQSFLTFLPRQRNR